MKYSGMNMGLVKRQNRSVILQYMNEVGPVSRKDIADATGLTPAAVTQITNVLLKQGILKELGTDTEEDVTRAGRKKVLIGINSSYAIVATVCIESETTVIAMVNLEGKALAKKTISTDRTMKPETFLQQVAGHIAKLREGLSKTELKHLTGISVTLPGIVDREKGLAIRAYGIWESEVAVREILETELSLPVLVENNVNAFAEAELLFGIGRQYDNFLLIKWGPGVGSAIVADKKLYEGRHGKAAEIGHYIVKKDGALCNCGRKGCLETEVSYQALNQIMTFSQDEFEQAYCKAENDPAAKDVFEAFNQAIDRFARTLVNTITILAPNRVVLYGPLFSGAHIRSKFIEACAFYDERYDEKRILYTDLAERDGYIGALASFYHYNIILQNQD